jgi:hypothetical protein
MTHLAMFECGLNWLTEGQRTEEGSYLGGVMVGVRGWLVTAQPQHVPPQALRCPRCSRRPAVHLHSSLQRGAQAVVSPALDGLWPSHYGTVLVGVGCRV